jgi:hypothetical protein
VQYLYGINVISPYPKLVIQKIPQFTCNIIT